MDSEALKVFSESLFNTIGFASQTVQLLLSLSTGVLAFTVTFAKELTPFAPRSVRRYLVFSWLFYFISIPFGIIVMMAFTGLLTEVDVIFLEATSSNIAISRLENISITSPYITIPAMLQFSCFFLGLFFTIIYGFKSLKYLSTK